MQKIKESLLISPFLVFFLINSIQVGIGVLGFQRIIAKSAGYDSWIAIIVSGILVHIVVWMMYKILENSGGDIISVHKENLGKWVGGFISLLFVLYLVAMTITVLRTFIEVLHVWMFPELNTWIFSLFFLLLTYYIITGGFRAVTGISFFSVVLPFYLIFMVGFPFAHAEFRNLMPFFNHSIKELAMSTKDMTLSIIGFEVLLIFYPFIKNAEKSKKWAHFGVVFTTFMYLIYGISAFVFYSEPQLEKQIWATLSMWKIVEMPFVERFEYIGIASWLLVILPNVCLTLWASSRSIKRLFSVKQRKALVVLTIIVLLGSGFLNSREHLNLLNDKMSQFGFYFIYAYIPFLFLLTMIIRKVRGRK